MQADGTRVTTVEGLADGAELTPIQKSFLDHGAYQCGFCTSGILMSATAFLSEKSAGGDKSDDKTREDIKECIHGNICRCTGYNSIVRAVSAVAEGNYEEERR